MCLSDGGPHDPRWPTKPARATDEPQELGQLCRQRARNVVTHFHPLLPTVDSTRRPPPAAPSAAAGAAADFFRRKTATKHSVFPATLWVSDRPRSTCPPLRILPQRPAGPSRVCASQRSPHVDIIRTHQKLATPPVRQHVCRDRPAGAWVPQYAPPPLQVRRPLLSPPVPNRLSTRTLHGRGFADPQDQEPQHVARRF